MKWMRKRNAIHLWVTFIIAIKLEISYKGKCIRVCLYVIMYSWLLCTIVPVLAIAMNTQDTRTFFFLHHWDRIVVLFSAIANVETGFACSPSVIIIKIIWLIELGKWDPYKTERSLSHDTKQAIEQRKETEINIKNQASYTLSRHKFTALLRAQGTTTKHARLQQVSQTYNSRQKRRTELICSAARDCQSQLT